MLFRRCRPPYPLARRVPAALLALAALTLPVAASAQVTWLVPSGGETWTAGTQHTIAWSGGNPTVFALVGLPVPPTSLYPILSNFPNTGYANWNIPANLPPGSYTLHIGFVGNDTVYVSPEFTIAAAPECLPSCQTVAFNMIPSNPYTATPPVGVCGTSAHQAATFAEAFVQSELAGQCFSGYSLDPGSVVIDVTVLPVGVCYAGYSGAFVAEASGFGCCCPDPVPATPTTWGTIKSRY